MGFISCLILQLVLVLQLQTLFVLSQNIINGSVPVGESLTASESQQFTSSWRSPSGDFAFGFRKIKPNDGFSLSIWFDKILEKTIVWHAQAVNTTTGLVPDGSKVTLTADGGLVVTDPRGQQLWRSFLSLGSGSVSRGRLTDAGNFILFTEGSEDSGKYLWSSFANPTDTLLPNQNVEIGGNLSSRSFKGQGNNGRMLAAAPVNMCGKEYGPIYDATQELGNMACGFNNLCILEDNKRPRCECPDRFVLKDPSDKHGDCVPDFEMQTCGPVTNQTDVSIYEFIKLENTNWPSGDYQKYTNYDEESCKASCLSDCFCAAIVQGDQLCWKKKFPLSYGQKNPGGDTLIKVLKRTTVDIPITEKRVKNHDWRIIACSVLLGTSAFVNFIFLALYRKKKKSKKLKKIPNQMRDSGAATATTAAIELNLRVFTYRELAAATGDFMEELGRGAFGIVYKGFIKVTDDSEVTVAVKKLDRVAQENEKEFKNEVKVIGQIHHKNLVKLIGFCNEGQSRMIVYEFLPHGTLASFLFRRPRRSWENRRRIAVGIARGILYLHEECSEQIIHCDIKPQNILLDEYYSPRISDFGLAKLLMMNQTNTLTNIRGTKGYLAAEWFRNSPITSKVDVYSFGVMLLEIVCCKKAVDLEDNVILIDWAYDCFRQGTLEDLIEDDSEAMDDMETVERYVRIAIWCIQEEPGIRPNMRKVTQMLEGVAQVHGPPNPSPYSVFTCDESLSSVPVSRVS